MMWIVNTRLDVIQINGSTVNMAKYKRLGASVYWLQSGLLNHEAYITNLLNSYQEVSILFQH